jgi:hypothetical protein
VAGVVGVQKVVSKTVHGNKKNKKQYTKFQFHLKKNYF